LPVALHSPSIVSIAHVRWATGTAITALDLCAAALARECCGWNGPRELDLRGFDPSSKDKAVPARRAQLPATPLAWVDAVLEDPNYQNVQGARNPLTHARLRRKLDGDRLSSVQFVVAAAGDEMHARDLVRIARDLATKHVAAFLHVVESL
jgi:hypothetical protein